MSIGALFRWRMVRHYCLMLHSPFNSVSRGFLCRPGMHRIVNRHCRILKSRGSSPCTPSLKGSLYCIGNCTLHFCWTRTIMFSITLLLSSLQLGGMYMFRSSCNLSSTPVVLKRVGMWIRRLRRLRSCCTNSNTSSLALALSFRTSSFRDRSLSYPSKGPVSRFILFNQRMSGTELHGSDLPHGEPTENCTACKGDTTNMQTQSRNANRTCPLHVLPVADVFFCGSL